MIGFIQADEQTKKQKVASNDDSSRVTHEIVTIIDQNFMAVESPDMADTMMTTLEIFDELQACFPSAKLTPAILAEQLQSLGFRLHMLSAMHLVWLMKRINNAKLF